MIDTLAPVTLSFDDEPLPARRAPRPTPRARPRASIALRAFAWALDAALLAVVLIGFVALATLVVGGLAPHGIGSHDYWIDLLLSARLPALWGALAALLAIAYSSLFVALGGRTPGQSLAGLRVVTVDGGAVAPSAAIARALWTLPSLGLGLFGFVLAAFDERGQTLHDKLARTIVVASR